MSLMNYTIPVHYKDQVRDLNIAIVINKRPNGEIYSKPTDIFQLNIELLNLYKDLIPNHDDYLVYNLFKVSRDKYYDLEDERKGIELFGINELTLDLPNSYVDITVDTIGHGTVKQRFNLSAYEKVIRKLSTYKIIENISRELGISDETIELCDLDGNSIERRGYIYYREKNHFVAVFNDYKQKVLEKGYEILDYNNRTLKQGRLMSFHIYDRIGNYRIVKFGESDRFISKRTPQMVEVIHADGSSFGRKKIKNAVLGEYIHHDFVNYIEGIEFGKFYAIEKQ